MKNQYTGIASYLLFTTFIFSAMVLHSCSEGSDPMLEEMDLTVSRVDIQIPAAITGYTGEEVQLTAKAFNAEGAELTAVPISWSSSDPSIAIITVSGDLELRSAGSIDITAAAEMVSDNERISISIEEQLIAFSSSSLKAEVDLADRGAVSTLFLDEPNMKATFISLGADEIFESVISSGDQIFYLLEGNAMFSTSEMNLVPTEGDVVFVRSGQETRISTSEEAGTQIIAVALNRGTAGISPASRIYSKASIESSRNSNSNVWNPFIQEQSMIFGLYMLPRSGGGDNRLVHDTDELNIVVKGSSRFQTDSGQINIERGSLIFVRSSNGHLFNQLNGDLDVLILWNQ